MAALKRSTNPKNGQSWNLGTGNGGVHAKSTSFSGNGSIYGGDDIFFTSRSGANSNGFNDFDVFAGLTKSSSGNNTKSSSNDDLLFSNFGNSGKKTSTANGFGADDFFSGYNSSGNVKNDDIFGSFSSSGKQVNAVDDLLGLGKNESGFDGLIHGFGASAQTTSSKTTTSNFDDPFAVLESTHLQHILLQAILKRLTEATKDSGVLDFAHMISCLQYKKLEFGEFCASALSVYQLERHARCAYELFEKDGNRVIMTEELASEL